MKLQKQKILSSLIENKLAGKVICFHSSYKSFGGVEGGIETLIEAFLESGCTLIVPAFVYESITQPNEEDRIERNGFDYNLKFEKVIPFDIDKKMIAPDMGAIPNYIINRQESVRSNNPVNSFAGIGSKACEIVLTQTYKKVYEPYNYIYQNEEAYLVLAGVDLTKATPIHFAEEKAGRTLFRLWAKDKNNDSVELNVGSCSEGFNNFETIVQKIEKEAFFGQSKWRIYPFSTFIDLIAKAIKDNNNITRCKDASCIRCNDVAAGGPILY